MQYLIISLAGAGALVLGILVYAGVLLHQARARIAALESALAESYRQLDAQRAELDDLTSEARLASVTALGMLRFIEAISEALYDMHQIKPGGTAAKRQAISNQIRKRMEDRVRGLEDDLQITVTNGAISVAPVIVNQLEQFRDKVQDKLDTADRYSLPSDTRGPSINDQHVKQIIEGWIVAKAHGVKQPAYCQKNNIPLRTFSRYKKIYRERRLDLLDSPDSPLQSDM